MYRTKTNIPILHDIRSRAESLQTRCNANWPTATDSDDDKYSAWKCTIRHKNVLLLVYSVSFVLALRSISITLSMQASLTNKLSIHFFNVQYTEYSSTVYTRGVQCVAIWIRSRENRAKERTEIARRRRERRDGVGTRSTPTQSSSNLEEDLRGHIRRLKRMPRRATVRVLLCHSRTRKIEYEYESMSLSALCSALFL